MAAKPVRVFVNARGAERLRTGHPWVFSGHIRDAGTARSGDLVQVVQRVRSGAERVLGWAFFNRESQIVLRLVEPGDVSIDREFWKQRLERALSLRHELSDGGEAERLVFAEADGIPGLIVDRYGPVLVLQTLCAGADRLFDTWVELLSELVPAEVVVERNDTGSRRLEGLAERAGVRRGRLPERLVVRLAGLQRTVDPLQGQKTGIFLDQRDNQVEAGRLARGRCLDVFSYQGGFGLCMAAGAGTEVVLLDQSERALRHAEVDARANDLRVETVCANAFDELRRRQRAGERFDTISVDPPAFAKNKRSLASALRGYKEINLRALKLLAPGGLLVTSSCSYHLSEELFVEVLTAASRDARREVQLLERRGASYDHPERLGFPESRYLKCLVARVW